ncbi:hypothetical protein CSW57_04485 [Williamsia muralis]|uniref:Uncharacterized protein n=1 Tax=Williamsia marianensis TaxID=85044 RepID=A0A2G3PT97_WILMA|nr:hypothetical protein CSW57_04485 [Williamsia marianensis]
MQRASRSSWTRGELAISPAALTLGISLYSMAILVGIGVGINAATKNRRQLAWIMATVVGVLVVAGVVVAVLSATTFA